jgi:hypothetical protein
MTAVVIAPPSPSADLDVRMVGKVSPYDAWFVRAPPMETVYQLDYRLDAEGLRQGVCEAVAAIPELSGCILQDGFGGDLIGHVPGLLQVEEAASDIDSASLDNLDLLKAFVRSVDGAPGSPLCRIRLTSTPTGDVLAFSLSHLIADGFTRRCFVEHLLAGVLRTPVPAAFQYQSRKLTAIEPGQTRPYQHNGVLRGESARPFAPIPRTTQHAHRVRLSGAWAEEAAQGLPRDHGLTPGDIVTAHCVKTWGVNMFDADDLVRLRIAVDVRNCLPAPDPSLVGNAFIDAVAPLRANDWSAMSLADAAAFIHEVVTRQRDDIKRAAHRHAPGRPLEEQAWYGELFDRAFVPFEQASDLAVANLLRLPTYIDFGGGPPVRRFSVGSASNAILLNNFDGQVVGEILSVKPLRNLALDAAAAP